MSIPNIPKSRQLSQERLKEVLRYDPETGLFNWRMKRPGCWPGREVGTITNGYRHIEIDYKIFRAARLAWLYMTGDWPDEVVDHINGNRSDDRWSNLRAATYQENSRNRKPCKRNTSGRIGVHPVKARNKWGAEIGVNGRNIKLGCFECKDDAVEARCAAEKHYFGAFARRAADGQ